MKRRLLRAIQKVALYSSRDSKRHIDPAIEINVRLPSCGQREYQTTSNWLRKTFSFSRPNRILRSSVVPLLPLGSDTCTYTRGARAQRENYFYFLSPPTLFLFLPPCFSPLLCQPLLCLSPIVIILERNNQISLPHSHTQTHTHDTCTQFVYLSLSFSLRSHTHIKAAESR